MKSFKSSENGLFWIIIYLQPICDPNKIIIFITGITCMSFSSLMELETMENALYLGKKIENESDGIIWKI